MIVIDNSNRGLLINIDDENISRQEVFLIDIPMYVKITSVCPCVIDLVYSDNGEKTTTISIASDTISYGVQTGRVYKIKSTEPIESANFIEPVKYRKKIDNITSIHSRRMKNNFKYGIELLQKVVIEKRKIIITGY